MHATSPRWLKRQYLKASPHELCRPVYTELGLEAMKRWLQESGYRDCFYKSVLVPLSRLAILISNELGEHRICPVRRCTLLTEGMNSDQKTQCLMASCCPKSEVLERQLRMGRCRTGHGCPRGSLHRCWCFHLRGKRNSGLPGFSLGKANRTPLEH